MALLHIDFYSNVLCRSMQADVILPEEIASEEKLHTLYLLHGMTDDHTIWQRRTSIERYADEKGIAVVMPSTDLGFYANTHAGERYFDFISDELVSMMRRMLPRLSPRREDTFVAGLSMGGYGALRCALVRPDVFSRAASLSGALDCSLLVRNPMPLGRPFCWEDVFGPTHQLPGSEHDLFHLAEKRCENRPEIWMWCGTEDELFSCNERMRDHLRALGYTLHWSQTPGDHSWKYWNREIQHVLEWLVPGKEDAVCP